MVDKVHVWRALAQTLPQTLPNILCRNAARLPPPRCLHNQDTDPQKVPQVCPVLCAEYAAGNGQQGQLEGNLNKFHSERRTHMK